VAGPRIGGAAQERVEPKVHDGQDLVALGRGRAPVEESGERQAPLGGSGPMPAATRSIHSAPGARGPVGSGK